MFRKEGIQAKRGPKERSKDGQAKGSEGDITSYAPGTELSDDGTQVSPESALSITSDPERQMSDEYVERLTAKFMEKFAKKEFNDKRPDQEEKLDGDEKTEERKKIEEHNKRVEDNWSYYGCLGECYIHGMMDGEAMAYQNNHNLRARVFELR